MEQPPDSGPGGSGKSDRTLATFYPRVCVAQDFAAAARAQPGHTAQTRARVSAIGKVATLFAVRVNQVVGSWITCQRVGPSFPRDQFLHWLFGQGRQVVFFKLSK